MVETFHLAAQYLATVAISFLEPKKDDSHTNLGWKNGGLHTHPLSKDNCVFSLDYESFSLVWTNDLGFKGSLPLDGKKHSEIVHWIRSASLRAKHRRVYEYKLHYELPYEKITSDYVFVKPSPEETEKRIQQRDLAQKALQEVVDSLEHEATVRIWPHHFDSGSFFMDDEEVGIGLGMAVPDIIINDFYFYVSGYKGHEGITLPNDIEIKKGKYYNDGWKGIALPVSEISLNEAIEFYQEAIQHYRKA